MSPASYRVRIFLTCWVVFCLHFATDFVREHFLVLSIGDEFSFRLDQYVGLHPDIFMTETHGAHHGANPGASMIAAIPYAALRPLIDAVSDRVQGRQRAAGAEVSAVYDDPRPMRREFYRQVRARGLDIKFGLAGLTTTVFAMAPLSALSAVLVFSLLHARGLPERPACLMALLYAFGTPVLFRTGYLNQNMMVGVFTLAAFALLWWPRGTASPSPSVRFALAGALAGAGVLCDYSGVVPLGILGLYALWARHAESGPGPALRAGVWYGVGALGPIALLWLYQYRSFGHFLYPGQHYMPRVAWIDVGYQGFGLPDLELLWMLWMDPRFGLFFAAPVLLLGLFSLALNPRARSLLPVRETVVVLALLAGYTAFFSAVQYTRLQWNTGIRYLIPVIPFLFLTTACVLVRLPKWLCYPIAVLAVAESWSIAMVRSTVSIPDSLMRVFLEGFQLPWLNTLANMATQYAPFLDGRGVSAAPFMALAAALVYGVWRVRSPRDGLLEGGK